MSDHLHWDEPECPPPGAQHLDSQASIAEEHEMRNSGDEDLMDGSFDSPAFGLERHLSLEKGSWVKTSDASGTNYDLIDMEDPRVPLWMLTDWVMNAPLEGPLGTEPLLLNPGLNVSAKLAGLIAARCKNALPARGVLRGAGARDAGRARQRVRWREPVVMGEQDPPGYEPTPEVYDAQTVPWVGSGKSGSSMAKAEVLSNYSRDGHALTSSESRTVRNSWWNNESSEASSNREAWSRSWATGSHESWDRQPGNTSWASHWTSGWDEPSATSTWRRSPDSQEQPAGHQWWQNQTPWHAASSWSDDKWSGSWRASAHAASANVSPPASHRGKETGSAEASSESSMQRWSGQPGGGVPLWKLNKEAENAAYTGQGNLPKPRGNRSPDRRASFEAQLSASESEERSGTSLGWGRDQRSVGRDQQSSAGWWEGSWGRRGAPSVRGSIPRPKEGWKHPKGVALAELQEGLAVRGTVTNITKSGAFVNIGAQKDGLLGAHFVKMLGWSVEVGDMITELVIGHIDLQRNRITLRLATAAKGGHQSSPLTPELGQSEDWATYDATGFDRWNTNPGMKKSRSPAGGHRGEPTTSDLQDGRDVLDEGWDEQMHAYGGFSGESDAEFQPKQAGWKGMHPMWTEGGTGGTRGARD